MHLSHCCILNFGQSHFNPISHSWEGLCCCLRWDLSAGTQPDSQSVVFEVNISEKGEQNALGGHGIVSFLAFVWCHLLIFSPPVTPLSHCLALECSLLYCNSDSSSPETVYSESKHPSRLMSSLLSLCLSVCWPLDAGSKKSKFLQVPQAFSSPTPLCSERLRSVALQSTPQQEEAFCICLVSHVPLQAEATSRENVSLKRFCNLQKNIPVLCPPQNLCPVTPKWTR